MNIGIVAPDATPSSGLSHWITRLSKSAPGHNFTVVAGMPPFLQHQLGRAKSQGYRQTLGNLETVLLPELWPFLNKGSVARDVYRYPTVAPEIYERGFNRVFAGRNWADLWLGVNTTEYDARNVAEGLARANNGRAKLVLAPYTNFGDTYVFDYFDDFLFVDANQRRLWGKRAANSSHKRGTVTRIQRSATIPPLLDAYQNRAQRLTRIDAQRNNLRSVTHRDSPFAWRQRGDPYVGLIPVGLWNLEEGQRVIDAMVAMRLTNNDGSPIRLIVPHAGSLTTAEAREVLRRTKQLGKQFGISFVEEPLTPARMLDIAKLVDFVVLPRPDVTEQRISSTAALELINADVPFVTIGDGSTKLRRETISRLAYLAEGQDFFWDPAENIELLANLQVHAAGANVMTLFNDITHGVLDPPVLPPAALALQTTPMLREALPNIEVSREDAKSAAPDAIFVMDTGHPRAVSAAVSVGDALERPVYIICSSDTEFSTYKRSYSDQPNVNVINLDWFNEVAELDLLCDKNMLADDHLRDLARKRNLATLLSAAMGYEVVAHFDNDVHGDDQNNLVDMVREATAYALDHPEVQAVGVPYGRDAESEDHSFTYQVSTGLTDLVERYNVSTKAFYGGGFEIHRIRGSDPWPAMYNDDWFQVVRAMARSALTVLKRNAHQLPSLVLEHPERAMLEETGDWLGETIFRALAQNKPLINNVMKLHETGDTNDRAEAARLLENLLELALGERFAQRTDLAGRINTKGNGYDSRAKQNARRAIAGAAALLHRLWPHHGARWFLTYLDSAKQWREFVANITPAPSQDLPTVVAHLGGRFAPAPKETREMSEHLYEHLNERIASASDIPPHLVWNDRDLTVFLAEWPTTGALINVWNVFNKGQPLSEPESRRLANFIELNASSFHALDFVSSKALPQSAAAAARVVRTTFIDGPLHPDVEPWYVDAKSQLDFLDQQLRGNFMLDTDERSETLHLLRAVCSYRATDLSFRAMARDRMSYEVKRTDAEGGASSFEGRMQAFERTLTTRTICSGRSQPPLNELLDSCMMLRANTARAARGFVGDQTMGGVEDIRVQALLRLLGDPLAYSREEDKIVLERNLSNMVLNGFRGFNDLMNEAEARDSGHPHDGLARSNFALLT